jgi:hypothetical protein
MPPIPTKTEWDRLTRRSPCLGVAWAGLEREPKAGPLFSGEAKWLIYLVVDNPEVGARFYGDGRGIGLVGMVTAAIALLHGWTVDGVGTTSVALAESLTKEEWGNDTTAIAGLDLRVPVIPDAGIAAAPALDDLVRIGATWLVRDTPAADDLITLGSAP